MKSEVDRCTAVYESESYPYFTINVAPPPIMDGNRGGTMAFFERSNFCSRHLAQIIGMGIYVNADCGFHVSTYEQFEAVRLLIVCYAGRRSENDGGIDYETL